MRRGLVKSLLASLLTVFILVESCAPALRQRAEHEGCDRAAERIAFHAEERIRRARFLENLKMRAALAPFTIVLGVLGNYLLNAVYVLPAVAPEGFKLKKKRIGAIGLERALHYTSVTGTRLERLEDEAIARTIFDVGMCYYRHEDWARAARYFEELRGGVYGIYIGAEKLLFLLGNCYYMMGQYDRALQCYREFLRAAPPRRPRRKFVRRRIEEITASEKYDSK